MATAEHTAIVRRFEVEHPAEHFTTVADHLLAPTVAIHLRFPARLIRSTGKAGTTSLPRSGYLSIRCCTPSRTVSPKQN